MKLPKSLFLLAIFFVTAQICFAQETPKAELIDEFGKICSEDLMARIDGFVGILSNDPTAKGNIVFYGDESVEGRNINFINYLTKIYPQVRGFDNSKFIFTRGENRSEMQIQFWIVPDGAKSPDIVKPFVEQKFLSTIQFDRNWAKFNRDSGELNIYSNGFLELGCEFSPNVRDFAKILLSNSELTGYLVVYTEFGKGAKYGNRIASFAVVDLMNNYKVPRKRLKTIYGGNRKNPEMEFWFVPKGEKPPIPLPDSKPQK